MRLEWLVWLDEPVGPSDCGLNTAVAEDDVVIGVHECFYESRVLGVAAGFNLASLISSIDSVIPVK